MKSRVAIVFGAGSLLALGALTGLNVQPTPGLSAKPAAAPVGKGEYAVTVEGAKQGLFKGESSRETGKGVIVGVEFMHDLTRPGGSRTMQHGPVVITKAWGASSPQFMSAAATGEELKRVQLDFYKFSGGSAEAWYTIKLTGARVEGVRRFTKDDAASLREEITIAYQTIEVEHVPSKSIATESAK